ncbi:MAG: hypothetical protein CUN55_09070 [Phototrophicales bacterium]|nr:MAG: hypothetical protein CUN55_09070 [Phototrophicales bacterium]
MKNINPSKNVNRRGRFYLFLGIFIFLIGLILIASGILLFLLPILGTTLSTPVAIISIIIGGGMTLGGLGLMFRGTTLKKDNLLAYDVGEAMRSFLGTDARYTFLRNVSKRGLGYIDAVLVGPPGALVFRIVDYKGEWINEGPYWRVRTKNGKLRPSTKNPTRECAKDVYALRKYLAKRNLSRVPVYGVVVFASDRVKLRGQAPVIPIAEKHTLYQILSRDYLREERINSPQIRKVVDALMD